MQGDGQSGSRCVVDADAQVQVPPMALGNGFGNGQPQPAAAGLGAAPEETLTRTRQLLSCHARAVVYDAQHRVRDGCGLPVPGFDARLHGHLGT